MLGGTLSPLDGIGPQDLTIDALVSRAHDPAVKELILALNATVDGQTTAHYITDLLHDAEVTVTGSRMACRSAARLDYLDEGTLSAAIRERHGDVLRPSIPGAQPSKCPRACSHHSRSRLGKRDQRR